MSPTTTLPSPLARRRHSARLVVFREGRPGETVLLKPDEEIVLGAGEECSVSLPDDGLADRHLRVRGSDEGFRLDAIEDAVRVNGTRVQGCLLRDGDTVQAGRLSLRVGLFTGRRLEDSGVHPVPQEATVDLTLVEAVGGLVQPQVRKRIDEEDIEGTVRSTTLLKAIYEAGALLSAETNPDRILIGIVDKAMEVLSATRGFLILRRSADGKLEPAVVRTPGCESNELTLSRTVLMECIEDGNSILLKDALSDLQAQEVDSSIFRHSIRSAVCVPVESKKEILGALYVDNTASAQAFDEEDLRLLAALGRMAGLALERALLIERQDKMLYGVIRALVSTLEAKDEYTRGHTERVTAYALSIAREMSLDDDKLQTLHLAGLLHDIGKIGVPEAILRKPAKLTEAEMAEMRRHPDIGADIVVHIKGIEEVAEVVRYHHERVDGSGYPQGLKGTEIPLLDRVLAVADTYDAMTSHRTYRRNFTEEEVMEEFRRCSGTDFDPEVVEAFFRAYAKGEIAAPAAYAVTLPTP